MRRIFPIAALALLLTGCTTSPEPVAAPTPTRTTNPAQAPCKKFERLTSTMADLVVAIWTDKDAEGDADLLAALPAEFDTIALEADGEIGVRMAATVSLLLDTDPIVMSVNPEKYFASTEAVARACGAESITITVASWT